MFENAKEAAEYIKSNQIEVLDVRFCDFLGAQHHFAVPAHAVDDEFFQSPQVFDASSLRGYADINHSDMLLVADPSTSYIDPFRHHKTLAMIFDVHDPRTGDVYERDSRNVAKKAEKYLAGCRFADTAYFAAEAEFFIFDDVRFKISNHSSSYSVDSEEGIWNSSRRKGGGNLGNQLKHKGGYAPLPPADQHADLRDDIMNALTKVGLRVEKGHHEAGSAGQGEINYRFNTLVNAADDLLKFKYVVKNTAHEWGKSATFMPKPIAGDNGSGMHTHQSLWKNGKPLFYSETGYANLSDIALWYIGGLLKHGPALAAFTNPSTNSYKRLVAGFEAPTSLVYSAGNRSAAIRIPPTIGAEGSKRIEYRVPDSSSNPYLAFSALLMAGIDGIKNKIHRGSPVEQNMYELTKEQSRDLRYLPSSLSDALRALEQDCDFLLEGNVFTREFISAWIDYKRKNELNRIAQYPHPLEFGMYYGV
ncbi:type I glutamate--ammonia ligase [Tropheryma whipplei]|uniref:type I glutamate--ammonia ligase n=1 Tax=Tropheryma whipplei TaxID=2039 RepID=UPI0004B88441|nr:type I glutamate--ammonia ligase [Tropheryma whipplei]